MSKAFFRRHLPSPEKIRAQKSLGFMRHRLGDPSLWHLNRRSASLAMFWGLFFAFMPMPFQMLPATLVAIALRANLPLLLLLTWVTNPITFLPMMYACYALGSQILQVPMLSWTELEHLMSNAIALSSDAINQPQNRSLMSELKPLFFGAIAMGLISGSIGYIGMRIYWRWHAVKQWQARAARRKA